MQSYSRQVDKNQSIDDLQNLGSTLNLPDGWSFETELLNQDLELVAEGEAYVIQDLLWNTYQKVLK